MIYDMLYPWQKDIVDKVSNHSLYGLFLDCGTGKTPISLALAETLKAERIIIMTISPKAIEKENAEGSWRWWIKTHLNGEWDVYGVEKKENGRYIKEKENGNNKCIIYNYEHLVSKGELRDLVKTFIKDSVNKRVCVLLDESHRIKNKSSNQTEGIFTLKKLLYQVSSSFNAYLLTGTPFTRGFIDLYTSLKFLEAKSFVNPDRVMSETEFKNNFCVLEPVPYAGMYYNPRKFQPMQVVGYKNIDALYKFVHEYALTVKSDDVIKLPDKIVTPIITECSKDFDILCSESLKGKVLYDYNEERKAKNLPYILDDDLDWHVEDYKENPKRAFLNPFFRDITYPDSSYAADTPALLWLRARELSIGFIGNSDGAYWFDRSRLDELEEFLKYHKDSLGNNYVLFYNYVPEFVEIYEICNKLGYNTDVYNGELKDLSNYEKYISSSEEEQLKQTNNIILANFASGSTGMNWQAYNKVIVFSIPLYKDYEQGMKRVHRIGQKNTVYYYEFYSKSWLDFAMREALKNNCDYSAELFNKELNKIFLKD